MNADALMGTWANDGNGRWLAWDRSITQCNRILGNQTGENTSIFIFSTDSHKDFSNESYRKFSLL